MKRITLQLSDGTTFTINLKENHPVFESMGATWHGRTFVYQGEEEIKTNNQDLILYELVDLVSLDGI